MNAIKSLVTTGTLLLFLVCMGCSTQKKTETIHVLNYGYEDSRYLPLEKAVAAFNQSNPHIYYELKIDRYTDKSWSWRDYLNHYKETKPDLVFVSSDFVGELAEEGYLEPLDDLLKSPELQEEYLSPLLPSTMYGNHSWGLLVDSDINMVYLNRSVLQELGYSDSEIAKFPERVRTGQITLGQLVQIADRAVEHEVCKYSMVHRPTSGLFFHMMADQFGAFRIMPDNTIYFSQQSMENMLKFFHHASETNRGTIPETWDEVSDVFIRGEAAVYFGNCWSIFDNARNKGVDMKAVENQYIPVLVPAMHPNERPFAISNAMLIALSKHSAHLEDLKEILMSAYSDWDTLAENSATTYHMPISKSSAESKLFQKNTFLVDNLYMMDYTNFAINIFDMEIWNNALFQAVKSVENGSGTPAEVAGIFAQDFNDRISITAQESNGL